MVQLVTEAKISIQRYSSVDAAGTLHQSISPPQWQALPYAGPALGIQVQFKVSNIGSNPLVLPMFVTDLPKKMSPLASGLCGKSIAVVFFFAREN
jgi:hypothetical protein